MLGNLNSSQRFKGHPDRRSPRLHVEGTTAYSRDSKASFEEGMPKLMLDISGAGSGPGNTRAVEAYTAFKEALLTRFLDSPEVYYTIKTGKTAQIESQMRARFVYEQRIAQGYSDELEKDLTDEEPTGAELASAEEVTKERALKQERATRRGVSKKTAPEPAGEGELYATQSEALNRTEVLTKKPSSEFSERKQAELRKQIHEQARAVVKAIVEHRQSCQQAIKLIFNE